jgi:hypothetical protein
MPPSIWVPFRKTVAESSDAMERVQLTPPVVPAGMLKTWVKGQEPALITGLHSSTWMETSFPPVQV